MIIERFFPKGSKKYQSLKSKFQNFGNSLDEIGIVQLFGIWTITVAGIVLNKGLIDRFVYWDWTSSLIGILKLVIVTILFVYVFRPRSLWVLGENLLSNVDIGIHLGQSIVFFLIGFISFDNPIIVTIELVPYIFMFLGLCFIYQLPLQLIERTDDSHDEYEWIVPDWNNKNSSLIISFTFMSIGVISGFVMDDPIISTAGMVALPFPLIALTWPSHVRHMQRARFYPLFIFAMFLCVRAPWFIIPLVLLFYFIRTMNYFRYGIVYPSFGVNLDDI